jgi:hypothetical protein
MRLRPFLKELLSLLKEDHPDQLRRIVRESKGLVYLQVLDEEEAVIRVSDRGITIESKARKRELNVRVYIGRDRLFDVLEGRLTLEEAVRNGDLRVFGEPSMILRCYGMWERVISLARTSARLYFLTYRLQERLSPGRSTGRRPALRRRLTPMEA